MAGEQQQLYDRGLSRECRIALPNGEEQKFVITELHNELGVSEIIRIPEADYPEDHQLGDLLVHFGLPIPRSGRDSVVILAKILERGSFNRSTGEEKVPLLSLQDAWRATITTVVTDIPYHLLVPDIFFNTIGHAENVSQLRALMVTRYQPVLPDQKPTQILSRGVSIRVLQLIDRISFP